MSGFWLSASQRVWKGCINTSAAVFKQNIDKTNAKIQVTWVRFVFKGTVNNQHEDSNLIH